MTQAKIHIALRKPADKITVLELQGDITDPAGEPLVAAYDAATSSGARTIILSFTGVESLNTFGVGHLITLLVRVRRQKQRLLAYGLSERHREILELTHLSEAMDLYADEAEALGSVGR